LILLFTRSLFRGNLLDGHDSLAYPPRLTEFAKILSDHQFPPVWAPDLGSGHGQPLFEFAPPLIYAMALPFFKAGLTLANSLQFGMAILFALGAIAVFLIGCKLSFSRVASIGAAAAWLYALIRRWISTSVGDLPSRPRLQWLPLRCSRCSRLFSALPQSL